MSKGLRHRGVIVCLIAGFAAVLAAVALRQYRRWQVDQEIKKLQIDEFRLGLEAVEINYGLRVDSAAKRYNLDAAFLKALCMLECSGRKKVPSRFEPHVFRKLVLLQKGKISSYESLSPKHLRGMSPGALRNLATSWGPFQLMGLKAIGMGCKVADLRGYESVHYAVRWIGQTYGDRIRNEQYPDAFHLHNTGRPYPKWGSPMTHDPQYVSKGMRFMQYYKKLQNLEQN